MLWLRHCFLLVLLCLQACTQPADSTIRFGLASAPANLDPRYATDATSARINRLLYQRLAGRHRRRRGCRATRQPPVCAPGHGGRARPRSSGCVCRRR